MASDGKKESVDQRCRKAEDLVGEALKAYGISREHVFAAEIRDGTVRILTDGGARVTFVPGQKVQRKLTDVEITGVNPEWERRKPITGARK